MRKLLVIAPSFAPAIGGVEKHLSKVLPIIGHQGYQIVVFARYSKNLPRYQNYNNIEVYRLPKEGPRSVQLIAWLLLHRRLWNDVDVVHSHDYFIPFLRKQIKSRWVHTFHGFESYPIREEAKKSRQYVKKVVDYSFAVGKFIEKWYGTPCDEIIWGASDMKPQRIGKAKKRYTYLFLGRLEDDTGISAYLNAFIDLAKADTSKRMLVVGDGSLRSAIQQAVKSHGLEKQVDLMGATKNPQEVFLQTKVALVSGYLAIIEAGRAGIPVVAVYENPLKKDYLEMHPAAKYMYVAGTHHELKASLSESVADKEGRSKKLQQWAKDQTWDILAAKYLTSYL